MYSANKPCDKSQKNTSLLRCTLKLLNIPHRLQIHFCERVCTLTGYAGKVLCFLNLSSSGSSSLSERLAALTKRSTRYGTTTSVAWFTSWLTISSDDSRLGKHGKMTISNYPQWQTGGSLNSDLYQRAPAANQQTVMDICTQLCG